MRLNNIFKDYIMPVRKSTRGRPVGSTSATKSRGTQTMKKVSKKGAYNKGVKNQMILRRYPSRS